ncbi:PilW family protein, partial [Acinetobacter baumannii]
KFFLVQRVYTENSVPVTVSELYCRGNGNTVAQPIFSGVQDLQILYGIAATGSQVPQQYFPANLVTDWNQVIALRVCVLMRTID